MDDRTITAALKRHWDASDANDFEVEQVAGELHSLGLSELQELLDDVSPVSLV